MKNILDYVVYIIFRIFSFLISLIPLPLAQRFAGVIGIGLFYLLKKRRRTTIENVEKAYHGSISQEKVRWIARESFRHMAMLAPEMVHIPKIIPNIENVMELHRAEISLEILKKGRGVILLVFHCGNWELMAVRAPLIPYPISAIGRPLKNPYIYRYIRNIRTSTGLKQIDKDGALKDAIRELRAAKIVAILCDQNAGARHPKVPFFGRPAHTFSTPVTLALQTQAEIVPVVCIREGYGHFICRVSDPVPLLREGPRDEIVLENMKRMNKTIEDLIRKHPEQWLWMHNRWKIKS